MLRIPCSVPCRSSLVLALAAALLAGPAHAGEAAPDPAVTTYGVLSPAAPAGLGVFSFLIGKWSGTAKARIADGTTVDYRFDWIGRYILDGMAIADEMRMSDSGAVQGMSFRHLDATGQWTVEFLNFNGSFIRKQVAAGVGALTQEGNVVTISQPGLNGALGRERYTVLDANHFTYTLGQSQDGGTTWDDAMVVIDMQRQ